MNSALLSMLNTEKMNVSSNKLTTVALMLMEVTAVALFVSLSLIA